MLLLACASLRRCGRAVAFTESFSSGGIGLQMGFLGQLLLFRFAFVRAKAVKSIVVKAIVIESIGLDVVGIARL